MRDATLHDLAVDRAEKIRALAGAAKIVFGDNDVSHCGDFTRD